jgi:3-dehydroquinate synthetase
MIKLNTNFRNMNLSEVYNNMLLDKKNKKGAINFVLVKRVGEVILEVTASKSEIFYALNNGIKSLNFR